MRYIVHLREKRTGKVELEAESSIDAINKAKRMIHTGQLPKGAIDRDGGTIVTFVREVGIT